MDSDLGHKDLFKIHRLTDIKFCLQFFVDIFPFDPDPDLDPGNQNFADPTDPDPKHCLRHESNKTLRLREHALTNEIN